ncbi:hypothetical protein LOC68_17090 [Blastopirellula sp. JC732]|uniref:Uncharacterized protein n=1 Tax=Blastopirellula sediminis TaxID=2894196 RepID=A0A9X1MNN5_9BACT|nr:hypothetical protein [Blastopirellula sediminis]MCC9606591.1 hypothetical protein [Blastopirellula sediminis]MCC9630111.1 hypothetical protein [Blastopirellula sediminis]
MTEKTTPRLSTFDVAVILLILMLFAYVASFYILSRKGIRQAEAEGVLGYDFLDDAWSIKSDSRERLLEVVYLPLIKIDALMASGRQPTDQPPAYYMTSDVQFYSSTNP